MRFKYIIARSHSCKCAIMFPEIVDHVMAINEDSLTAISAGFAHVSDGHVIIECEGSLSLNLMPDHQEDTAIITRSLRNMGLL